MRRRAQITFSGAITRQCCASHPYRLDYFDAFRVSTSKGSSEASTALEGNTARRAQTQWSISPSDHLLRRYTQNRRVGHMSDDKTIAWFCLKWTRGRGVVTKSKPPWWNDKSRRREVCPSSSPIWRRVGDETTPAKYLAYTTM